MRYKIDHDLHIHTFLSACSGNPEQTPMRILQHAKDNGLERVCVTDHFWDKDVLGGSNWYSSQDFEHVRQSKPLPRDFGVDFMFGCEAEMDKKLNIGITKTRFYDFDFVIIPTTHLHMNGFTIEDCDVFDVEKRARLWVLRLESLLSMDLPFHKIGIAHLACRLINPNSRSDLIKTLNLIPDSDMERLFAKASALGCGVELNQTDMGFDEEEKDVILRPFRIAKNCGCKFYLGSDAHNPQRFTNFRDVFERAINLLSLEEKDKFSV